MDSSHCFVVKNDDGKNDHRSYKSIYFNYFLISYYRVRLFLAMQVRVMAACMESQSFIRSAQSRPRDGTCVSDVCGSTAWTSVQCLLIAHDSHYGLTAMERWFSKFQLKECIPVGCLPTVAVAITRCHYWGVSRRHP